MLHTCEPREKCRKLSFILLFVFAHAHTNYKSIVCIRIIQACIDKPLSKQKDMFMNATLIDLEQIIVKKNSSFYLHATCPRGHARGFVRTKTWQQIHKTLTMTFRSAKLIPTMYFYINGKMSIGWMYTVILDSILKSFYL